MMNYDEASSSEDEAAEVTETRFGSDTDTQSSADEEDGDGEVVKPLSVPDIEEDASDLPLNKIVQRHEQRGISLQDRREKKRNALKIASKRLRDSKKQKTEEPAGTSGKVKKSKHAPTEVSSSRSEFYKRGVRRLNESGLGVEIGANHYKALDPRTSNLSGHLNEEQFEKNYDFLQEMRTKEISRLKSQISARKKTGNKGQRLRSRLNISNVGSIEEDEEQLRELKQEKADFERRQLNRAAKQNVKKKLQQDIEVGKSGAFFLKRKEKKKLEFEARMEELQKRKGHKAVEKTLARRRQKAKSRDSSFFTK